VHRTSDAAGTPDFPAHDFPKDSLNCHTKSEGDAVATVRRGNHIGWLKFAGQGYRKRLLPLTQVRGAVNLTCREQLIDPLFEDADFAHPLVPIEGTVGEG
jgi:hypothetical protein